MTETMNNRLLNISGGSRSGKNRYAEQQALALPGPRTYIVTSPVIGKEMDERIARHRFRREKHDWLIADPLGEQPTFSRSTGSNSHL